MAIWSLTQERVDKLMQQIGEKEQEVDTLIKLTVKDLWTRDLDDFIAEWRFQLEDDHKRQRKVANMGRRASNKLKIGAKGAGKKGKAKGDDDSDYEAAKAKKPSPKKPTGPPTRVQPKVNPAFFDALKGKTMEPAKRIQPRVIQLDGSSDPIADGDDDEGFEEMATAPKAKSAARKATATKAAKPVVLEDAGEAEPPKRTARGAAKKAINYGDGSDSESDGEDMLGDVSNMVKGVGGNVANSNLGAQPLFPAASTTTGNAGTTKPNLVEPVAELSDDDTDFSKLVPKPDAPKLSDAVQNGNGHLDGLSSSDVEIKPAPPLKPAVAARAKATTKKPASKATTAPKTKKAANGKTTATVPATKKKATPLSPAAKAYAAKQAARKLLEESDSDDDFNLQPGGGSGRQRQRGVI